MLDLVFYSEKHNELVVLCWMGFGVSFICSDEYEDKFRVSMQKGIGFVFQADWVFVGNL